MVQRDPTGEDLLGLRESEGAALYKVKKYECHRGEDNVARIETPLSERVIDRMYGRK